MRGRDSALVLSNGVAANSAAVQQNTKSHTTPTVGSGAKSSYHIKAYASRATSSFSYRVTMVT